VTRSDGKWERRRWSSGGSDKKPCYPRSKLTLLVFWDGGARLKGECRVD